LILRAKSGIFAPISNPKNMESLFTPGADYSWEQIRGMMADLVLSHQETERRFSGN